MNAPHRIVCAILLLSLATTAQGQGSPSTQSDELEALARRFDRMEHRLEQRHNESSQKLDELQSRSSANDESLQQRLTDLAPRLDSESRQLIDLKLSIQFLATLIAFAAVALAAIGVILWRQLSKAADDVRVLKRANLAPARPARRPV